jgi:hypothetical protein
MITIKTDKDIENNDVVQLYDSADNLIGDITSGLILTDICVQIRKNKLEGYYVIFQNERIEITSNGKIFFKSVRPFRGLTDLIRELI